jgi:glycerophosphoryl diester phosphodiesterase
MLLYSLALTLVLHQSIVAATAESPIAFFQAHRGGIKEAPENTLAALEHGWSVPGGVPEVDLRTTSDGVIVCIHDETPERTTDAPEVWRTKDIREIPYSELSQWDAGVKFNASFAGAKIPSLREVFNLMKEKEERELYLDMKDVSTEAVHALIKEYGFETRIIFVHASPKTCLELSALYPGARTMTWLSGPQERIRRQYEMLRKSGFAGISQLQFHLQVEVKAEGISYQPEKEFVKKAAQELADQGKVLQLCPSRLNTQSLAEMFSWGVRWYVTDEPAAFYKSVFEVQQVIANPKTL